MVMRLVAVILAAALMAGSAAAQTAFAPAAIVNDSPITYYDIEQRARILTVGGAEPGPSLDRAALEQLIDDRLRVQAGEMMDITATAEQITGAASELAQRQGLDRSGLVERVVRAGATEDALIDLLRAQVVWRELVNARFGARATPTEGELDQEIEIAASGRSRSFNIAEIAIPIQAGQEEEARRLVERIEAELASGVSFAALARRYSRSPSAPSGGEVGWIPEAAMPADIAEALSALSPGQATGAISVPGGASFFLLNEVRTEAPPWAREAEVELVRVALPVEEGADEEAVAAARSEALKVAGAPDTCEGQRVLNQAAMTERIPRTRLITLPNTVQDAVRLLGPGQFSRPIRTEDTVDVFVVCDREGGVDQEARERLRTQIRTARLTRFAEGYLQELRRDAVIERR